MWVKNALNYPVFATSIAVGIIILITFGRRTENDYNSLTTQQVYILLCVLSLNYRISHFQPLESLCSIKQSICHVLECAV